MILKNKFLIFNNYYYNFNIRFSFKSAGFTLYVIYNNIYFTL